MATVMLSIKQQLLSGFQIRGAGGNKFSEPQESPASGNDDDDCFFCCSCSCRKRCRRETGLLLARGTAFRGDLVGLKECALALSWVKVKLL